MAEKSSRLKTRFAPPTSAESPNAAPELDPATLPVRPAPVTVGEKPIPVAEPVIMEAGPNGVLRPAPADAAAEAEQISDAVKRKLLEAGHKLPPGQTYPEGYELPAAAVLDPPSAPPVPAVPDELPAAVTLAAPFAYWLEEGEHDGEGRLLRAWQPGRRITDPDEIRHLYERGAPIEAAKE